MKLTQKHFKFFKDRCQFYIDLFNLNHIEFSYELRKLKNAYATSDYNSESQQAAIVLNSEIKDANIEEQLDITAFHEVMEVQFIPIYNYIPSCLQSSFESFTHSYIHRLYSAYQYREKAVFIESGPTGIIDLLGLSKSVPELPEPPTMNKEEATKRLAEIEKELGDDENS